MGQAIIRRTDAGTVLSGEGDSSSSLIIAFKGDQLEITIYAGGGSASCFINAGTARGLADELLLCAAKLTPPPEKTPIVQP